MDGTEEADERSLECIGRRNRIARSDIAYRLPRCRYNRHAESQNHFMLILYKLFPKAGLFKSTPNLIAWPSALHFRISRLVSLELLLSLVSFFGGFYSPPWQ